MPIDGWRIHRRIGMSGGLFTRAVAREVGRELSAEETDGDPEAPRTDLPRAAARAAAAAGRGRRCSPTCAARGIVHGIATSGGRPEIDSSLEALERSRRHGRDRPRRRRAGEAGAGSLPRLRRRARRRAAATATSSATPSGTSSPPAAPRMLSIGLLSGGYGADELLQAGAFRVYADAADLHRVARRARLRRLAGRRPRKAASGASHRAYGPAPLALVTPREPLISLG